ncbi:MAG TPA: alpha/beta fold hydrolase [bacterium]|nr:alpha/beta fold hydrolase [bacterium]
MGVAKANGVSIHYREAGTGPALLLLHAFPLHAGMWEPQLRGLAATYRVIAPDARGFGDSPESVDVLTMETIADDAVALLAGLGVSEAIVCGLSMGGYAALAFLRRHSGFVRGLVLADTRATADTSEGKSGRENFALDAIAKGAGWVADAMLPRLLRKEPDPAAAASVRGMIAGARTGSIAAASRGLARRADSTDLLPSIRVPTLVVVGQEDLLTPPADARSMRAAIPGSHLVEIPGAAHLSNLENPDAFNAAIVGLGRA